MSQPNGAPKGGGNVAPPRPYPFPVGVYESGVQDYEQALTMSASPQQFPVWNISPTGWLRGLWFDFQMTTASNAATVVFNGDPTAGGFCGVQKVILYDLGGEVVLSLSGYEWLVMN